MKSLSLLTAAQSCGVLLLTLMACSKNTSSHISPTTANLIGTYQLTFETGRPAGGAVFNEMDSLNPCQRDDLVAFNADSTYDYLDGGLSCSPSNSYVGTWDLLASDVLVLNYGDYYLIKSFDNKSLVLTYMDFLDVPSIEFTLTLVRQ